MENKLLSSLPIVAFPVTVTSAIESVLKFYNLKAEFPWRTVNYPAKLTLEMVPYGKLLDGFMTFKNYELAGNVRSFFDKVLF